MNHSNAKVVAMPRGLEKVPTGIRGLDELTMGGLPKGRPTLVCGSAGCGKTLLGIEFLVHGAIDYKEPGVLMAFEETESELASNVTSLGMDLRLLVARKKLRIDSVRIERSEIEETGEYDLGGLFIRLGAAIDSIGAKRVVLDTIEVLFAGLSNHSIVRSELRRLFRWLKDKGVTAIVTAERGNGTLTRFGLEEYVADCVIMLDHRVTDQLSTRRLRIVKYRGSFHGTNEFPFLIGKEGISVLPITSMGLDYQASNKRVSTGLPRLDSMLGGQGYYVGSSVLISGAAGSGKTSLAAAFAQSTCRRGERCLYLAFEESPSQIMRNMRSIGFHLEPFVKKGLLQYHACRPTNQGLESHLAQIGELVRTFQPAAVVVDPVTSLLGVGEIGEVKATLARLTDLLKARHITALYTSLTAGGDAEEQSEVGISSLMDTWLLVRNLESDGERNRGLFVLKSRGMGHSNQVREFVLSDKGIRLVDVYAGQGKLLTGSARLAQEERERAEEVLHQQENEGKRAEIERRRAETASQIESLSTALESADRELQRLEAASGARETAMTRSRGELSRSRKADSDSLVVRGGTDGH
jgi:circadian clock protein KaiC